VLFRSGAAEAAAPGVRRCPRPRPRYRPGRNGLGHGERRSKRAGLGAAFSVRGRHGRHRHANGQGRDRGAGAIRPRSRPEPTGSAVLSRSHHPYAGTCRLVEREGADGRLATARRCSDRWALASVDPRAGPLHRLREQRLGRRLGPAGRATHNAAERSPDPDHDVLDRRRGCQQRRRARLLIPGHRGPVLRRERVGLGRRPHRPELRQAAPLGRRVDDLDQRDELQSDRDRSRNRAGAAARTSSSHSPAHRRSRG